MAAEFSRAVELGVKMSKRIYYGKDRSAVVSVPPLPEIMKAEEENYLPTAPMVYAEINDPGIVDNPDVPSYQPYVYGRCDPPALIPLHMHRVTVEVDCFLDTAFVTVSGAWRVHCVTASRSCSCRIAVPMGEQGSVLGVQVENGEKSFNTELISVDDAAAKAACSKDGFLIKGHIYTLKVPQIRGGTFVSLKFSWSQKLSYQDGQFRLNVPFTFPSYVNPMLKSVTKKEKILVNVNSGTGTEVFFQNTSHPLKRTSHQTAKTGFSTERDVLFWSRDDFNFSYNVTSDETVGGVLLQSPSLHDYDQREMFCMYLYPGTGKMNKNKVFKREVVFLVDTSASMQGTPLDSVKTALLTALVKLTRVDTFTIIAFNESSSIFSSSLVQATKEMTEKASEWIQTNFIGDGGTNISVPLNQAINMFSKAGDSLPIVLLITDGAVEDENDICEAMSARLVKGSLTTPRISTFGIGSYCNHYFLQMLAQIGRGYYDAGFDIGSVNSRLERLISNALSVVVADINIDSLKDLDSLEIYPARSLDLSSGSPLLIWGRYTGSFPDNVEVDGTLADLEKLEIHMKVQYAKDIPVDRVIAGRQVNLLTTQAWLSGSKHWEEKASKLSLITGFPSEYTSIILIETNRSKLAAKTKAVEENVDGKKMTFLRNCLAIGFGNLEATAENRPPEQAEPKLYETSEMIFKAATNLCAKWCDCCCCMCFLQFCSKINDQCAIALTQLCTFLACFECINICCEICSGD